MFQKVLSNWATQVVSLLTIAITLPVSLRYLGAEAYGIWLVIAALTGYLVLLQLGMPMALVRSFSLAKAHDDETQTNGLIVTFSIFYGIVGLLSLLMIPGLLWVFEAVYGVHGAHLEDGRTALILSVVTVALTFFMQMPHAMLSAHHKFEQINALKSAIMILKAAATLALVPVYPSLLTVAWIQLAGSALEVLAFRLMAGRIYPAAPRRLADFRLSEIRTGVSFSIYVFLLGAGSQLMFQTSTLIVGAQLGPASAALYSVPVSLVLQFVGIIVGIAAVVMPVSTELDAQGRHKELQAVIFRWSKIAMALTAAGTVLAVVFGPHFLVLWLGPAFEGSAGYVLQILLLSMLVFLPLRGAGMPMLMGIGQAVRPTVATLIAGVASCGLSLVLGPIWGIEGVAAANALATVGLAGALLVMTCRSLDVRVRDYAGEVGGIALPAAGGLLILGLGTRQAFEPLGLAGYVAAGAFTAVALAAVWTLVVLRHDRHVEIPPVGRAFKKLIRSGA